MNVKVEQPLLFKLIPIVLISVFILLIVCIVIMLGACVSVASNPEAIGQFFGKIVEGFKSVAK